MEDIERSSKVKFALTLCYTTTRLEKGVKVAVSLEGTIYGRDGESVDTKLMPNLQSVKQWADDNDALAIQVYDFDKETESLLLKAGLSDRWQQASESTFKAVLARARDRSE